MPMRVWVCVCVTHTDKEASLGPPDPVRCEETSNIQPPHPPQEQEDKQNRKRKEEEGGRGVKGNRRPIPAFLSPCPRIRPVTCLHLRPSRCNGAGLPAPPEEIALWSLCPSSICRPSHRRKPGATHTHSDGSGPSDTA